MRVKHCWRLMGVLIKVEVSTDTADPNKAKKETGKLKAFMTCADLLTRKTDSSKEKLRGKTNLFRRHDHAEDGSGNLQ